MYGKVTTDIRRTLEGIVGPGFVSDKPEELEKHGMDETSEPPHLPDVVVKPAGTAEVSAIMRLAYQEKIPVTPQGSRTGLSGGAHPLFGGIALSLERMNKILEIDENDLMAVVQPGVLIMEIHRETEKKGLLYPPDPGEESGSLGGNISTNAGGVRGLKYGVTRDYVQGLVAVLANGDVIRLGEKFIKDSSGYSLMDLIIGSEGTLAVVTEATLKLVPMSRNTALVYIPFNSTRDASQAVSEIIRRKVVPYALEYISQYSVLAAERYLNRSLPDNKHPAYLLIGVEGNSSTEVDAALETVGEVCLECGAVNAFVADTAARQQQLWEARKCLFTAHKAESDLDEVDMCIPRSRFPDYIEAAEKVMEKHGILVDCIGHAGDGNIHANIFRKDMEQVEWLKKSRAVVSDLVEIGLTLGGTVSGEHGIGFTKKAYLPMKVGQEQLELMKAIKKTFDPQNILNPGKLFDL